MHSTATVTRRILPFRGEDASVATRMADVVPFIRAFCRARSSDARRALSELFVEAPARLC